MAHWAASLFANATEALAKRPRGGSSMAAVTKSILRYPIKMLAAFLMAPFLALRVASLAKSPLRRLVAGIGLFIAVLAAWLAGTFLGTFAGALLVTSNLGFMWGIAFLFGATTSVTLSVAFSVLVLNATAWLFLQLSSEEVLDYLRSISE